MRIIVTGTVGLDKGPYLEKVRQIAGFQGQDVAVCHVGRRMYDEAPDVAPGRILDLPLARLHQLRRSVIKDILVLADQHEHVIVNTHATFRWKHGLFPAFDFDQLIQFDADMYVCLIDNVDAVHARLIQEHQINHSLKDLLVWREEEILATEMMMLGCKLHRRSAPSVFYVLALGREYSTAETLYRLMMRTDMARAYLSFPMTHVADVTQVQDEIDRFRRQMWDHFVIFDPADVEEHELYQKAAAASQWGQKVIELEVLDQKIRFDVAEVLQAAGDINAQIYARDFQLIDQADMIISYIPELADGKPGLSSGVERELQHAHEATREVFVVWRPRVLPSPFITETATRVFTDIAEAKHYFQQAGYGASEIPPSNIDTLFPP
ncbi:MAG: AAA family ATPase [Sedimentisphaerales bacterium]|nr:AAA family ATPase [Sedimentisphaerales bacterium]